jgi:hypothetical protein
VNQRARLNGAAFDHLPWLPPALAARLRADTAIELQAPVYYAWLKAAPAAAPDPQTLANTPCNLQPAAHSPALRRDARGRLAARPKPALRGRKAELEAARQERERLAPWRAGIKEARLIKRLLRHQAQTARRANHAHNSQPSPPPGASPEAGTGLPAGLATGSHSVAGLCHGGTLAPVAQRENPDQDSMHPPTVVRHENSDQDAMHPRTVARCKNPDQDPVQPRTVARRENPGQHPTQPRTVPHPAGPAGAAGEAPNQHAMQRGAGGEPAAAATAPASREPADPPQPRSIPRRPASPARPRSGPQPPHAPSHGGRARESRPRPHATSRGAIVRES